MKRCEGRALFEYISLISLELLGKIFLGLLIVFFTLLTVILLAGYIALRTGRILFPNFISFMIDLLYEPAKRIISFFKIDSELVDRISVELKNCINYADFATVPTEERVLLLPQCMRSLECPAKLSSVDGFHCVECGRCEIARINAACKRLGIRVFVVPGGTFAKRVLISARPRAVVGVACYPNLHEGMLNAKLAGIPAQGVPLKKTGCINTIVDFDELLLKLFAGTDGEVEKAGEVAWR
ncbi:MAG: putative redox protein with CxxCxxC motif [Candidatus Alkanophagales archaeon MCA70_species_2]|nr:putative redox protein with CxxCxxC motif [Candidatus Alkanophaga liquidiphilum]